VKNPLWIAFLSAALAASCRSTPMEADPEVMMERWNRFMTPGEGHARLADRVGSWNMHVRMFNSPDMPPDESDGTSVVQWIMDGRYLEDTTTGVFNGQPFHGRGTLGYDNLKGAYVGTWIDNFGTGILHSEGHYDPASKTFEYSSSGPDLMYTNDYVPMRSTERWIDADHWIMQSFSPGGDGEEFMNMEIEYTRMR